jgi:hypothetical protein
MKNLFELSQEEKNRIINLHENATKRLYLVEQEVVQGAQSDPYQYRKTGDKVEYATKGANNWKTQTNPKGIEAINKLFTKSTAAPATAEGQPASPPPDSPPASPAGTTPTGTTPTGTTPTGTTPTGTTPTGTTPTGTTPTGTTPPTGTTTPTGTTPPTGTTTPTGATPTPEGLTEKIKQNCGEIWKSFEGRLKGYQAQMKDKDLKAQKDIARVMSKDENKVFRYCHKLYAPKVTADEKTKFGDVGSNFKKFLSASYKFLSPAVVKMMSSTVEKVTGAGGDAVLRSLKIGEEYNNHKLDKLIQESIRKNTKNL